MGREEHIAKLEEMERSAALGGGQARIDKQHDQGKWTARERIDALLDPGSFVELDKFVVHQCRDFDMEKNQVLGDGVVTGFGRIEGRLVYVFAQDFTVFGGSLSSAYARKICKIMDLATRNGAPVIGLNDSGGARTKRGSRVSLGMQIFSSVIHVHPVLSRKFLAVLGPCAGGAVYSPAITDFIAMVDKTSYMFVTGPDVIKTVTHEEVTKEALGGAATHSETSGVAHFKVPDEASMMGLLRSLLLFIPQNNMEEALPTDDPADRAS